MVVRFSGRMRFPGGVLATGDQPGSKSRDDRAFLTAIRLCLLTAVLSFAASSAISQISPGPLSKAHQSLSGTTQCASCHQFGSSTPTFKCLDCHKEIAQRL